MFSISTRLLLHVCQSVKGSACFHPIYWSKYWSGSTSRVLECCSSMILRQPGGHKQRCLALVDIVINTKHLKFLWGLTLCFESILSLRLNTFNTLHDNYNTNSFSTFYPFNGSAVKLQLLMTITKNILCFSLIPPLFLITLPHIACP